MSTAVTQFPIIADPAVVGIILASIDDSKKSSWISKIANEYPSDKSHETYASVGNVAPLREFIGEKAIRSLNDFSFQIVNKEWESTLRLFQADLRRDKINQLMPRVGDLGRRAAEHMQRLLSELIDSADGGTHGVAFDNQYFFDTDHEFGNSGAFSNSISVDISGLPTGQHGSVTVPSPGEVSLSILAGINQLFRFKDDQGEPTNCLAKRFAVMCPTSLGDAVAAAVSAAGLAAGEINLLASRKDITIEVIENPRLTWTDQIAVFRTDGERKPFAVQTEVGANIEALGAGSDYAFHNRAHLYSVWMSGNVGFQRFDQACLVTLV